VSHRGRAKGRWPCPQRRMIGFRYVFKGGHTLKDQGGADPGPGVKRGEGFWWGVIPLRELPVVGDRTKARKDAVIGIIPREGEGEP